MKVLLCVRQYFLGAIHKFLEILKSTENLLKSCKKALKINLEIHGGHP